MPIYDYRCASCGRRSSILVRSFSSEATPSCPACKSTQMRKLVSRFAVVRSEDSRLESMADPSTFADVDENNPRSVAKWARRMGKELGEEAGPEFDEMVDRMEAGEMGEEDLAGAGEGMDGGLGDFD